MGAAYLSQISIYTSESRKTCLPYQHQVTGAVARADDHTLAVPVRSLRGEDCIAVVGMLERAGAETKTRAMGPIRIACLAPDLGEAVMPLPGRYPVTPQIRGALKSLPGVVTVEEL